MSKEYKIKRNVPIYRKQHTPLVFFLRGAATVVILCILGFVGWNAYAPIRDYFSGALTTSKHQAGTSSGSASGSTVIPAPEPIPAPIKPTALTDIRAVYLPLSIIRDPVKLTGTLEQLSRTEINAVLFDLKDDAGNVLYRSQSPLVTQAKSQVATAYDLAALCKTLTDSHFTPIGQLSAFRDPIAASHIPDAGVKYKNTELLWLDDSPENGGKPWLNPYSELAQAYIADLATECISLGVQRVMLDQVSFPTGYGPEFATYGTNSATRTRSEILSSFIDSIEEQVTEAGGEVSIYISGLAALGANNTYYGSNPLALANENITIGVMPAQFGDAFTLDQFSLEAPVLHPGETVDSLLKFIAPDIAGKNVTALLQAYPAPYTLQNNMMYTADDINAQIGAAAANGIGSYITFHPEGVYPAN